MLLFYLAFVAALFPSPVAGQSQSESLKKRHMVVITDSGHEPGAGG
jgi:hypothetical protein